MVTDDQSAGSGGGGSVARFCRKIAEQGDAKWGEIKTQQHPQGKWSLTNKCGAATPYVLCCFKSFINRMQIYMNQSQAMLINTEHCTSSLWWKNPGFCPDKQIHNRYRAASAIFCILYQQHAPAHTTWKNSKLQSGPSLKKKKKINIFISVNSPGEMHKGNSWLFVEPFDVF